MTRGCTLALCTLALLRPAAAFVAPTRAGIAVVAYGTHPHRQVHAVRPRDAALLAHEPDVDTDIPDVDTDIPGVADSRLAGWRVSSKVADSPGGSAGTESAPSEASTGDPGEPACGDVVEYPLSDLAKKEADDDREKGVAVIVSINKNRNDAWQLPEDILDKAELQVLCPDLGCGEEGVWMADELEACAFAKLGEMKVVKSECNGAMDKWKRWTISEELSEGCGARDAEWEYDMI